MGVHVVALEGIARYIDGVEGVIGSSVEDDAGVLVVLGDKVSVMLEVAVKVVETLPPSLPPSLPLPLPPPSCPNTVCSNSSDIQTLLWSIIVGRRPVGVFGYGTRDNTLIHRRNLNAWKSQWQVLVAPASVQWFLGNFHVVGCCPIEYDRSRALSVGEHKYKIVFTLTFSPSLSLLTIAYLYLLDRRGRSLCCCGRFRFNSDVCPTVVYKKLYPSISW